MTQLQATAAIAELTIENEGLRGGAPRAGRRAAGVPPAHGRLDPRRAPADRARDLTTVPTGGWCRPAMSLGLLEAKLASEADAVRSIAQNARQAVATALEELHELSHGI